MQCNHQTFTHHQTYFCILDEGHKGAHTYFVNGQKKQIDDEAARIAELEAENAELKARLERIQSLYDQAAQTIRNQSETIRRGSRETRDFVGID